MSELFEWFTLESEHPYTPMTYDGIKYRVEDIKSAQTIRLECELLEMDRMSPQFLNKRREYEKSANADFDTIEARNPDYSPKFYQNERDYYQLLRPCPTTTITGGMR